MPKAMPKATDLEHMTQTALASAAEAKGSDLTAEEVEGVCWWVGWWGLALRSAAEGKGSDLTDDEIEGVAEWICWWVLAAANGCDPVALADAMRAEAKGKATVH